MVSFSHFFTPQLMKSFLVFSNPDMQLIESTQLVEAHARDRVKRLNSRLEELDIMKDAEFFQKNVYDELMKIIEELNVEELTQLEGVKNTQNALNNLGKLKRLAWGDPPGIARLRPGVACLIAGSFLGQVIQREARANRLMLLELTPKHALKLV
ncbi:hypothetical protein BC332_34019 [Capsicum chinense]|nr:hypothetical protein BC332_34019 [Capsicum chinense]